jgi:hypothetical protein
LKDIIRMQDSSNAVFDEVDATDSPVTLAVLPVWGAAGFGKKHFHRIVPPPIPVCSTSRNGGVLSNKIRGEAAEDEHI